MTDKEFRLIELQDIAEQIKNICIQNKVYIAGSCFGDALLMDIDDTDIDFSFSVTTPS